VLALAVYRSCGFQVFSVNLDYNISVVSSFPKS